MTNPDDTVTPVQLTTESGPILGGLTKREHFALEFAKVMIRSDYDSVLSEAVRYADILISKLNQKDQK